MTYADPFALAVATLDGGLAAATTIVGNGSNISTYYGGNDSWVVKLDAEGHLLWERTLGTLGNETLQCLVNARDGGLLVGVTLSQITSGNIGCGNLDNRNVLVKLDSDGNFEWNLCFPTVAFTDVIEYDDGYLLAGTRADTYGSQDCALMRCDAEGHVQWIKSYGGSGKETVVKVFEDGPNGYTVFANTTSLDGDVTSAANLSVAGNEAGNIWVFHVDAQGDLVWERCIGSSKGLLEEVGDVVKTDERQFLLVGDMTWFAEDSSGDIHCTNSALIPNSKTNIWVLHVTDEFDYSATAESFYDKVSLHPNPAKDEVTVTGEGILEVEVHNLLGQRVTSMEGHDAESLTISLEGLPQGVYLVSVRLADGKRCEKKLVIQQ